MLKVLQVDLPVLHVDQVKAYEVTVRNRFAAIRCGRRWGKTELGKTIASDGAIKREYIGWFAPSYRLLAETFTELSDILNPVITAHSKPVIIRTRTGGRIDFWSLENESAGRSRKYHKVIIDEGAFTKPNMLGIWQKSIRPTLLDYGGSAIVCSNTNGLDPDNFFWRICNEAEHGFKEYHAPTHNNPFLPKEELEKLQRENHPLVYQQEYLAEFVDWTGVAFFSRNKLLVAQADGSFIPLERPERPDVVLAVIDTAVKTGKENDGTAVIYFALSKTSKKYPLTILDWDIVQIEGAVLESWLPSVFLNLSRLANEVGARMGSVGAFIEDKTSGSILLQQAKRRNWPAHAIDSVLTGLGKDERAINVSGYVFRELVKFTKTAYDKVTGYKQQTRNHLVSQVLGFRIGDKEAFKRADDLLDCFCYGIAITLGNAQGF